MNCPVTLEEVHITVAQYLFATPVDEANSRAEAGTHSIFWVSGLSGRWSPLAPSNP
ncbi:hypothetical protein SAMN04487867_12116 [Vreelandella titanicae]|uniref:Uncharacterized protein n=1 Tax=Vreelandella titanicae TaxID=664683 RepID=A0AAP9NSB7_9GAMM|nr:hypothetical protein FX987_05092 [Halomonas titanicae]SDJ02748.1 hypothetical protein SAMN04487867_12116 [Halomonas titanicae]